MIVKLQVTLFKGVPAAPNSSTCSNKDVCKFSYSPRKSSSNQKVRFKIVNQNLGDRWKKLNEIDTHAVQEKLNIWLSKTQDFVNEVASPRAKTSNAGKTETGNALDTQGLEDMFVAEQTMDSRTPNGTLSLAAVVSIEQFSRMNGLTGRNMQKIFKALVPDNVCNDARNLVEYCCFRFLSRDTSDLHPSLKEPAFQRLIFVTMLAWQNPYSNEKDLRSHASETASLQGKWVGEEAFTRIASAVSGVADHPTARYLFKVLAGDEQGISLNVWLSYIDELVKVHEGRKSYQNLKIPRRPEERILCIGSGRKRPVLKWENNMAWPGKLTLTDKALYFEAAGLLKQKDPIRLDLTKNGLQAEKTKVGPFGSDLFDSAVSVSSSTGSEKWLLEFVDLGGELRRDIWYAFISEVISLHKFLREYGPEDDDRSLSQVFGAHKGKERAIAAAINSISRLQALQHMKKSLDDPVKFVQYSFLQNAPQGDIVCQTLAVKYWGGPLVTRSIEERHQEAKKLRWSKDASEYNDHVIDVDGSVYLRNWMRSPSWNSSASANFWKNYSIKRGVVLSKSLVVAELTHVEKAALACQEKFQVVEKTQATIDAATLKGIPSNIDLFKELLLPLAITAKNFEKLRRWEKPHLTASFLVLAYTVTFRNLLSYVFPAGLMVLATTMLTIKGLREQGRLGRSFGLVTIHDQPPSNTIQKIIAVKDAMQDVENYLQSLNVALLKFRTIILAGQPQVTTEVSLALLASATILLLFPFKYVIACLLFDAFTRELEFRKEMVKKFMTLLKERWVTVPATPVVVLPFEMDESTSVNQRETDEKVPRGKSEPKPT